MTAHTWHTAITVCRSLSATQALKIHMRNVLCLNDLDGYSKGERNELAEMLTEMI